MYKVPVKTWKDFEEDFQFMEFVKSLNYTREELEKEKKAASYWPLIEKQYRKEAGKQMHQAGQNMHQQLLFAIDYWEKRLNETEPT